MVSVLQFLYIKKMERGEKGKEGKRLVGDRSRPIEVYQTFVSHAVFSLLLSAARYLCLPSFYHEKRLISSPTSRFLQ